MLTDIAEPGTFTVKGSTIQLTDGLTGDTSTIPVNPDGSLGDRWALKRQE